ncbi:MAG: DNA-binding response regulator [Bacteroidetes bacterium GWA2_31_9]|nr:MAG: DNA-binding response regulator [Bacteroidetes bacterium GWA2_31_9]
MKIKCIAIDDEPLALEKIKNYISKVSFLELVKTFSNGIETIDYLRENKVDLMFLDIQMEELTGIQLLEVLTNKPKVIFTTAYDSFALKGYDLDVADYLLKPISFDRFLQAVNKIYISRNSEQKETKVIKKETTTAPTLQPEVQENFMFVKTEYRMQKVMFEEVLYIEGMKDYLRIITKNEKIMTLQNFQGMLDMLPQDNYIRIHKSYIIAINKIDHIDRGHVIIGKERIPIGESYKQLFFEYLKKRKLI